MALVIGDLVSLDPFIARPIPGAATASSAEVARQEGFCLIRRVGHLTAHSGGSPTVPPHE